MMQKTFTISDAPAWLPPGLKIRDKDIRFQFRFTRAERRVFKKRKAIPVSRWAEQHRVVTYGPKEGQKWDNMFMPHLRGIMDASFFPSVQVIGNCKAPQTGGSSALETCLVYAADCKPGGALIVFPDKDTARCRSTDYLQPVFQKSPRLRKLLTGYQDDMAGIRIKLLTMLIYMGWAGSATSLGNVSVKYLLLDEVDKYPDLASKKEAGTLDLARKRVTAYKYDRKTWINSTPTMESGPIWQYMTKEAQVIFDYWVQCPECGEFLLMSFDDIDFDGVRDPMVMDKEQLARYVCRECGSFWDDAGRDKAVRAGHWRARDDGRELMTYLKAERPRKICFHTPAWISHCVSLSEVAVAFLKGLKSKIALRDFMNNCKAEPWLDYKIERPETAIQALRDDRPREVVPGGGVVQALLGSVDTQDKGFWYEIRAWGWGESLESWQVREGWAENFTALEQVLFADTYKDAAGNKYHVQKTAIDAMGHRTAEVYDFCRKHRGRIFPIQGKDKLQYPYAPTSIDRYPGTNKPIPGGIVLYRLNVTHYKDVLASKLEIAPADPGAWHYHQETPDGWCRQMTVEYVDDRGLWVCPEGKANHAWDVSVYMLWLVDFLRLKYRNKPKAKKPAGQNKKSRVGKSNYLNR